MGAGLQIFNPAGTMLFDSSVAVGGVCMGFVSVPAYVYPAASTLVVTYPDVGPGRSGFVVSCVGGFESEAGQYDYDNALGYPRFTLYKSPYDRSILLFLK